MNIEEIIENRASCRNFKSDAIPDDILRRIFELTAMSPSGGGFQGISMIKVTDVEKKKALVSLCRNQTFIERAPISIVFCIDLRRIKRICELEPSPFDFNGDFMNLWMGIIDASIAAQTMCLAAENHGLSSVYIGNLIHALDATSQLLEIPQYVMPVIMVTMGYPKNKIKLSPKFSYDIIVHENTYKDMSDHALLEAYHTKNKSWGMKPKGKILEDIYSTAKKLRGKTFAEACIACINQENRISPYQYWFGSYYSKEENHMDFRDYVSFMNKQGFTWMGE